MFTKSDQEEVKRVVRTHYAEIATKAEDESGGCCPGTGCCGADPGDSLDLGYSRQELDAVPVGANLGLGCGNPQQIAELQAGEVVVDLGSGGGFDCFLAARQVGDQGQVIGVDFTPEMIARARANASKGEFTNVEFRLGEIEHLPVADSSADVILSNCVINLSPDKHQVFREALRILRPGGRLAVSDVVAIGVLPESIRTQAIALSGCIAGAAPVSEIEASLNQLGFEEVTVTIRPESREFVRNWLPGTEAEKYVSSAEIRARKPRR